MKELQPAFELWQHYQPEKAKYAFRVKTLDEAKSWQKETRQAFSDTLGFQDFSAPLDPKVNHLSGGDGDLVEVLEQTDKGSYIREKILLRTATHSIMPVYLLIPKNISKPIPTVLAFHGHGYGVKDIVGKWEDGTDRDNSDGIYQDFAVELCKQGFAAAAPEISCFGERQTDFSYLQIGQTAPSSCMHAAMLASHLGGSIAGIRVRDSRRLIVYLETRSEFDTSRLGAMGLSGGGMVAMFTTCLDERIKACVISGYFSSFQHSIHAMHHCGCNYVHHLAQFGEIYDLAGLIAPRPLFIEAGTHDPIFPIKAVKESVAKAQNIYGIFSGQNIVTDYFEGRHRVEGVKAYPFLKEILAG